MKPAHVLFYDDWDSYGGHEVMTVAAARFLAEVGHRVSFMVWRDNATFIGQLDRLIAQGLPVEIVPISTRSERLAEIRSALSPLAVASARRDMARLRPDVVVVAQGRIELSVVGLLAAKLAGLRTVSYLPLAHSLRLASSHPGASVRDLVGGLYYRVPDQFITCSDRMGDLIRRHNPAVPVSVVYNGIDAEGYVRLPREEARRRLGLRTQGYVVTLLGRVAYRQKCQDFLLEAVAAHADRMHDVHLLFVGFGPDYFDLAARLGLPRVRGRATVVPWTSDVGSVLSATDMLAIPSRFEGFPLVMLEAMLFGLPVVATDLDGMADILPPEWLFPFNDADAFCAAFERARASAPALLERHRQRVLTEFNRASFGRAFEEALLAAA